jgi:hypothetical protein
MDNSCRPPGQILIVFMISYLFGNVNGNFGKKYCKRCKFVISYAHGHLFRIQAPISRGAILLHQKARHRRA